MFRSNCRFAARRASLLLVALAAISSFSLTALTPRVARAQNGATTYSTTQRNFKVGILLFASTVVGNPGSPEAAKGPENPDPYVFYIADKRTDLKPQGWTFTNPIAPATVTSAIKARWDARVGNSGYQIGQKVTPDMAAYWEVSLTDTPISQLTQFDMLFITNHRKTQFTDADREKLRKLVDAGGVLWVEDCGGMVIGGGTTDGATGSFFLDQVQFEGNGFGNFTTSGPAVYQPAHPILNTPYALTLSELSNLGDKNYGNYHMAVYSWDVNKTGQTGQVHTIEAMPNRNTLVDIVGNTGAPKDPTTNQYLPYIAAGHYGSGSVLLTSGDSGCDINDNSGGTDTESGRNSGSYCGTLLGAAHSEDLKFLYNIVNWGSSNSSYRRNDRRTAASFESLNAPLLPQFNFASLYRNSGGTSPGGDRVKSKTAPLLANGLMFVSGLDTSAGPDFTTGGNVTVRSYDTQPFRDYDSDGNYDDGLADISLGLPYDEVWRYQGGAATASGGIYEQPSSPVLATVLPNSSDPTVLGAQVPVDKVFVSGPDGTLYIFPASQNLGAGSIPPTVTPTVVAPDVSGGVYDAAATHGVAPAPVVFDGVVYQVEPDGQVRAISPDGTLQWRSFNGVPPATIVPTATPTVGFSQNTANTNFAKLSGYNTNDLMLYVPAEVTPSGGQLSGQVLAYFLGTRNEVQTFMSNSDGQGSGGTAIIDSRVAGGGGSPLAGALYVANGSPFITPSVRVYSGATAAELQANYEQGNISQAYQGTFINTGGVYDGRVQITKIPGAMPVPADPGLSGYANIWVSLDYDVSYISGSGAMPTKPPSYDAVNPIGARADANLTIPTYLPKTHQAASPTSSPLMPGTPGGGMDTMTLSPEDLLLFSTDQGIPPASGTGNPTSWVSSVLAMHEQINATQVPWRFTLHDSGAADGTTDGVGIVDYAPIFNYNQMTIVAGTYTLIATPQTHPEYISQLKTIGSPVTTNGGLTYVIASGLSTQATLSGNNYGTNPFGLNQGPVTVLMAFQTNPTITLSLPVSFDPSAAVQVSQVNSLDNTSTLSAGAANAEGGAQLRIDAQRGKITLVNFITSGGWFSASQSFVVTVTPVGETTPRHFVVHPLPPSASNASYLGKTGVDETGTISLDSGGYTPLQWYYVLPGTPTSAPTLIGDYLFFNMTPLVTPIGGGASSYGPNSVVAVDANPAANDAAVRVGFGEPILNIDTSAPLPGQPAKTTHLHWIQPLVDLANGTVIAAYAPPVGSQGTLAVSSTIGAFAFEDQTTLIADGRRLIEVGPDSAASWTLNSTLLSSVVGGDLPITGTTGNILNADSSGNPPTGRLAVQNQTLAHPTIARKIGNGDYLIADSGNNRVVRVDRGGKISWKLDKIFDTYNLMGKSDPKNLNGPTDVQYYIAPSTKASGTNALGYEAHYLVADPGNFRILEVADYFDSHGNQIDSPYAHTTGDVSSAHSLVWITRTQSAQGQRLGFTNIQRFLGTDPSGAYSGYPYVIATVGNSTVGGASSSGGADFTGGALVSMNYAPYVTTLPINALSNGAASATSLWPEGAAEPLANGTVLASANDLRETNGTQTFGTSGSITPTASNPTGFNIRRLSRPAYFSEINLPNTSSGAASFRNIYLICDSSSVYAIEATVDTKGNAVRDVLWKFTQADYDVMNVGRLGLTGAVDPTLLPRLVPASVKLLPNGDFLITNSYYGRSGFFQNGQFNGEVFQVTPRVTPGSIVGGTTTAPTGGFSLFTAMSSTVTAEGGIFSGFASPKIVNATGATTLFVQEMGTSNNTNLLEQPLFSDRQ